VDKAANQRLSFDQKEENIDPNAPLLIDATLPILYPNQKERVRELASRWIELMKSLGVSIVLTQSEEVFKPGSLEGLDEALFSDFKKVFKEPLKGEYSQVIFRNHDGCATGLALAWLEMGGEKVVSSFGGVGSLPALEEIRMALHVNGALPLTQQGHPLRHLKELFEYLSATKIDDFKAVTGRGIFALESGVHVDGLLKEPSLYEPFAPEVVGARRYLSLGLHSGHKALLLKCDCLELPTSPNVLKGLLKKVKEKALALGRGLTDSEFEILYSTVKGGRKAAPKKPEQSAKIDPPSAEKGPAQGAGQGDRPLH
jgi:isopropylmalate/homocitrate/citramalate synthase